ncbi:MAG: hypothetical protein K8F25_03320, partial [Fimbriimonadaceae bacterium]|nr:hypothetical protein [Alphaproteobacteria bacterium]
YHDVPGVLFQKGKTHFPNRSNHEKCQGKYGISKLKQAVVLNFLTDEQAQFMLRCTSTLASDIAFYPRTVPE